MKEFEKFIISPFFGCKNFVVSFFNEIKKYHPEFREQDVDRKKIFLKLYAGKQYNDGLVRRMTSDLVTLAEEFIAYKCFRETVSFRETCLLNELRLRKLDIIFENKSNRIISEATENNIDSNSLLTKFFAENQRISFYLKNNQKKLLETSYSASNSFITFFLSALNNKTQIIEKRKNNLKAKPDSGIYENFISCFNYTKFIKSLENVQSEEAFYIKTNYYFHLISLDKNDVASYKKLKELLYSNKDYFKGVFKYNFFITLSGFCSGKIFNNNFEYLDEFFYNIKIILSEKLFLANSVILSSTIIRQVITFSIMQKKYDYTESFIQSYSKYFNPKDKTGLINYSYALLMFAKKDYGKALEFSSVIDLAQAEFKKDIRFLKTKIYFELDYTESFYSEIDASRHFLSYENNLDEGSKLKAKNFIKFIFRLYKLKAHYNAEDLYALKKQIEKENKTDEKQWLLEKTISF